MKARIISISILMFLLTPFVNAQKTVQEILMSHQWYEEPLPVKEPRIGYNKDSRKGYEFDKDTMRFFIFMKDEVGPAKFITANPYYLSDTPPDSIFDKGRVGKTTNGKYLIALEMPKSVYSRTIAYELVDIEEHYIKLFFYPPEQKGPVYRIWRPRP